MRLIPIFSLSSSCPTPKPHTSLLKVIGIVLLTVVCAQTMATQKMQSQSSNGSTDSPLIVESNAKRLFQGLKNQVFQIRIIEIQSGEKSTIGSGFLINDSGWIVSNYHVISLHVNDPKKYQINLVSPNGAVSPLQVLDVDVVHDLALLSGGPTQSDFIQLRQQEFKQGSSIFSLGNPRDLGMTVVEGNYNGLLLTSFYKKILISGSLNPGMSGGPAVDINGDLVGVNVATQGNQIGFLVALDYLKPLIARNSKLYLSAGAQANLATSAEQAHETKSDSEVVPNSLPNAVELTERITAQLIQNQNNMVGALLASDWLTEAFGQSRMPGAVTDFVKCWGGSPRVEKALFKQTHKECFTQDKVYLSSGFDTGVFAYSFSWYRTDTVNQVRFYNQFEQFFQGATASNRATRDDVGPFNCNQEFIDRGGKLWRGVVCARSYKRYPKLFDVVFTMASVFKQHEGLIVDMSITGVEHANAVLLLKKFMDNTQWN